MERSELELIAHLRFSIRAGGEAVQGTNSRCEEVDNRRRVG